MNLSHLLYPGNSRRRQNVINLHQELLDGMQLDFKVTNDLIATLNEHLGAKMRAIKIKEGGTIKENCDIIIQAMNSIQQKIWRVDKEIKERLEPGVYLKLYDIKQPELEKIAVVQRIVSVILGEATASAGAIAMKLICSNVVTIAVNKLVALLAQIGVSVLGGIALSALALGIDIILQAILGAVEKEHLLASIQSYEQHLAEFKEASETYRSAIAEVNALVKGKAKLTELGSVPTHQ